MNDGSVRNVVILGAAWAGQSAAHYFIRHILPSLKSSSSSLYRVVLIDSSSHFYYKTAAPRALVDSKAMPHKDIFTPIEQGFKQYGANGVTFHHAEVTEIDRAESLVHFKMNGGGMGEVKYYALVIATGTRTPTPLTSLHGDYTVSQRAIDSMNDRLRTAKEVIITGGGPVGIETAGEIGQKLNGPSGLSARKVKITVIAGSSRILPVLRAPIGLKAEKMLNKLGVEVLYNARVTRVELGGLDTATEKNFDTPTGEDSYAQTSGATQVPGGIETSRNQDGSGKTYVFLEGGKRLEADVYIPAAGVTPNTEFLPKEWVDADGYVKANKKTLRVDVAGPRVYVVGDVGDYSKGGILDLMSAMPVFATNIWNDLVHANKEGGPKNGAKDRLYKPSTAESQIVPIGPKGGVGAFNGFKFPSFAVKMIKGKDLWMGQKAGIVTGSKYAKP